MSTSFFRKNLLITIQILSYIDLFYFKVIKNQTNLIFLHFFALQFDDLYVSSRVKLLS
jgi:hypothetical protein